MHFVGINCLFRGGIGGPSIQVFFKTGSTVIAHRKNNNVLIPPYNQLISISWRNLPIIFFIAHLSVYNIKAT